MSKQSYWIRDPEGVYAQVEGTDQRDFWTKVQGWVDADEPGPTDQVHVVNENPEIGPGRLPFGALPAWGGLGWAAGPPPGEGAPASAPSPKVSQPKTATSGDKKE